MSAFSSAAYWEARYRANGASGAGSLGRLARFKAGVINRFVADNQVRSAIDLGCGDGSQLGLLDLPAGYVGVDASPAALAVCAARCPGRRLVGTEAVATLAPAEMTLSLDVLYHLTEEAVFAGVLAALFGLAQRFVLIYSSNVEVGFTAPHVRHRRFTDAVAATQPDWRLVAHLPNPYPFDPGAPDETSFADFFVYARGGGGCAIAVPGGDGNESPCAPAMGIAHSASRTR